MIAQAEDLARRLGRNRALGRVVSYWDGREPTLRARDGGEALITARVAGDEDAVRNSSQKAIAEDLVRAELIALPVTLVLLVGTFATAAAALLPLLVWITAVQPMGQTALARFVLRRAPLFAGGLLAVLAQGPRVGEASLADFSRGAT